jgi:hypothetical protein
VRQSSETEPSLAAFDDQLLMAFVADNDTNVMLVCLSPDGQTWSGNLVVSEILAPVPVGACARARS